MTCDPASTLHWTITEHLKSLSDPCSFIFPVILFTAVSAGQMAEWAAKKHRVYKKEHGAKYPKNRKRMIPFIY